MDSLSSRDQRNSQTRELLEAERELNYISIIQNFFAGESGGIHVFFLRDENTEKLIERLIGLEHELGLKKIFEPTRGDDGFLNPYKIVNKLVNVYNDFEAFLEVLDDSIFKDADITRAEIMGNMRCAFACIADDFMDSRFPEGREYFFKSIGPAGSFQNDFQPKSAPRGGIFSLHSSQLFAAPKKRIDTGSYEQEARAAVILTMIREDGLFRTAKKYSDEAVIAAMMDQVRRVAEVVARTTRSLEIRRAATRSIEEEIEKLTDTGMYRLQAMAAIVTPKNDLSMLFEYYSEPGKEKALEKLREIVRDEVARNYLKRQIFSSAPPYNYSAAGNTLVPETRIPAPVSPEDNSGRTRRPPDFQIEGVSGNTCDAVQNTLAVTQLPSIFEGSAEDGGDTEASARQVSAPIMEVTKEQVPGDEAPNLRLSAPILEVAEKQVPGDEENTLRISSPILEVSGKKTDDDEITALLHSSSLLDPAPGAGSEIPSTQAQTGLNQTGDDEMEKAPTIQFRIPGATPQPVSTLMPGWTGPAANPKPQPATPPLPIVIPGQAWTDAQPQFSQTIPQMEAVKIPVPEKILVNAAEQLPAGKPAVRMRADKSVVPAQLPINQLPAMPVPAMVRLDGELQPAGQSPVQMDTLPPSPKIPNAQAPGPLKKHYGPFSKATKWALGAVLAAAAGFGIYEVTETTEAEVAFDNPSRIATSHADPKNAPAPAGTLQTVNDKAPAVPTQFVAAPVSAPSDAPNAVPETSSMEVYYYGLSSSKGATPFAGRAALVEGGVDATPLMTYARTELWNIQQRSSAETLLKIYDSNPARLDEKTVNFVKTHEPVLRDLVAQSDVSPGTFQNKFIYNHSSTDFFGAKGLFNLLLAVQRTVDIYGGDAEKLVHDSVSVKLTVGSHRMTAEERFARVDLLKAAAGGAGAPVQIPHQNSAPQHTQNMQPDNGGSHGFFQVPVQGDFHDFSTFHTAGGFASNVSVKPDVTISEMDEIDAAWDTLPAGPAPKMSTDDDFDAEWGRIAEQNNQAGDNSSVQALNDQGSGAHASPQREINIEEIDAGWDFMAADDGEVEIDLSELAMHPADAVELDRSYALLNDGALTLPAGAGGYESVKVAVENGFVMECATLEQQELVQKCVENLAFEKELLADGRTYVKISAGDLGRLKAIVENAAV